MQRTNLWNDCASRVALDQRAREAHLQLERIERQFVPYVAVTDSWLKRLRYPFAAPASVATRCERAGLGGR